VPLAINVFYLLVLIIKFLLSCWNYQKKGGNAGWRNGQALKLYETLLLEFSNGTSCCFRNGSNIVRDDQAQLFIRQLFLCVKGATCFGVIFY
jgi:hypothetical protein